MVDLPENITLSVDYSRTLEAMITACGYYWWNSDITAKRFLVRGEGIEQSEAKIFIVDRNMSSALIVEMIKAAGWDPSKVEHLIAFGEKYPEEQRKYPIIALGSVAKIGGYLGAPRLYWAGTGRSLGLYWWDVDCSWNVGHRFLAVRKPSSAP